MPGNVRFVPTTDVALVINITKIGRQPTATSRSDLAA